MERPDSSGTWSERGWVYEEGHCGQEGPRKGLDGGGGRGVEAGLGEDTLSQIETHWAGTDAQVLPWLVSPGERSNVHTPLLHLGGPQVWSGAKE